MQSGGWFLIDGAWYWLAANGAMATGWLNDGGAWYWLDPVSGRMATGTAVIDGRTYFFDDSGHSIEHKWDARQGGTVNGDIPVEKLFTCTLCGQTKTLFRNATVERIAGNYRNQTAAAISSKAFDSSEWVVVARDDDFADAMSATGLAGALECPIVLTGHQGLSAAAAAEIEPAGRHESLYHRRHGCVVGKLGKRDCRTWLHGRKASIRGVFVGYFGKFAPMKSSLSPVVRTQAIPSSPCRPISKTPFPSVCSHTSTRCPSSCRRNGRIVLCRRRQ